MGGLDVLPASQWRSTRSPCYLISEVTRIGVMCKKTEGDVVKVKCSDFAEFIEISIFRTSCGEGLSSFEGAGRRRQDHYVPPEAPYRLRETH